MFQVLQAFSRPRPAAERGLKTAGIIGLSKLFRFNGVFQQKTIDLSIIAFAILLYVAVLSAVLLKYCYGNTKSYGIFQRIQSEPCRVNLDV